MLTVPPLILSPLSVAMPAIAAAGSGDVPSATADQVLSPYIYVFYAAFIVAFLFTPVMRQVALYYNVVDAPDAKRKLHARPIAYLGGVAMFLGWVAGLAISQGTPVHRAGSGLSHLHLPVPVVTAAAIIVALGLWDDLRKVRARVKIGGQVLAAAVLLWGGIGAHSVDPLMAPVLLRAQVYLGWDPAWLHGVTMVASWALTVALVVGCCNATNLLDGMDGLAGGVTSIVAAGFTFLAVNMATFGSVATTNADGMRIVLGLALLGSILGFVLFNFAPASIFMGDTGSMLIGFSCATLIATMAEEKPRWFLAALVMFALPVLDTALAFARRFMNNRPLFSPDRHHIHHQIERRGYTVRQTVLIAYAVTLAFVLLGAAIVFVRVRYAVAFYLVIFASIGVAAYKSGMVHELAVAAKPGGLADGGAGEAVGASVDADDVMVVTEPSRPAPPAPTLPLGVYEQAEPGRRIPVTPGPDLSDQRVRDRRTAIGARPGDGREPG
jgi:UDP-GlcNAc:undecaprenyl-phosphate GlcNAc-1-phosphate transferase